MREATELMDQIDDVMTENEVLKSNVKTLTRKLKDSRIATKEREMVALARIDNLEQILGIVYFSEDIKDHFPETHKMVERTLKESTKRPLNNSQTIRPLN